MREGLLNESHMVPVLEFYDARRLSGLMHILISICFGVTFTCPSTDRLLHKPFCWSQDSIAIQAPLVTPVLQVLLFDSIEEDDNAAHYVRIICSRLFELITSDLPEGSIGIPSVNGFR